MIYFLSIYVCTAYRLTTNFRSLCCFFFDVNLQMGQNPIRNPTNPFPPYKSSPPNQIQPSTLIIQTTPNHCIISSQTKLNCLTVHGFNPLESISQSKVSVHGFRALSSELIGFSLASLNLLSSVLYLLLAETWINVRSR